MGTVVKIVTEHRKPDFIAFIIDPGLPSCLKIPSDIIRFCLKISYLDLLIAYSFLNISLEIYDVFIRHIPEQYHVLHDILE